MEDGFSTIKNEDDLKKIKNRFYSGGKELKVGDRIIFGFCIDGKKTNSKSPSTFRNHEDTVNMDFNVFVLNEDNGFLYQLYSISKK